MNRMPTRAELVIPTYLVQMLERWYLASCNGSLTLHLHEGVIQKVEEHRVHKTSRWYQDEGWLG